MIGRVRCRHLTAVVSLALALSFSNTGWTTDYLHPDQLQSGMKGHGLSVFKGTKPERFEVEIVGVLKNTFPKQDMILIRMSGANLEKHKVIAGMSGSPIYINGKLIGALGYGWMFENEPLAGVTPIHNMLAELNRNPITTNATGSASRAFHHAPTASGDGSRIGAPQPLLTPLSLGGFSPRVIQRVSEEFESVGLLPVAAGGVSGGASGSSANARDAAAYVPGGAIGVALIRGDFNAVAVGTVTHVESDRVLAFGHPFFGGGFTRAPAMIANVQTIMSSMARSFKMAVGTRELGAMVGDWQSCIVADTSARAEMLPVAIEVANRSSGHREHYNVEVMRNPLFTARLALISILQAINVASGASDAITVSIEIEVDIAGDQPGQPRRVMRLSDTTFNSTGDLISPRPLAGMVQLFHTPFGNPTIECVRAKVDAVQERRTAEIKRAYFADTELTVGKVAPLTVVLKPFGQDEVRRVIDVMVPRLPAQANMLTVTVMDGASAPPDAAPPDNLDDYLNIIGQQRRGTDLVALVPTRMQGLQYRGRTLRNLPASVHDVLNDNNATDVNPAADVQHLVVPTDWVLTGQITVRIPVKEEPSWE